MRARIDHHWGLAVLVIGVVAAFLLIAAWQLQMHPDEVLSYRSTDGDLAFTLNMQTSVHDNQAPLWFVSFWTWRQLVGDGEFTSRVFGVLAVMLALSLTYQLGRRWFHSDWVGLLAPLLLIGNGLFFNYALDIRPYPMVMLSAALCMWAFTLWLDRRTTRSAVFYGLTITLILYLHYLLIFLVVVQVIYWLTQKPRLRDFGQAALAGIVGVVLWLPWFPTFLNQITGLHQIETQSGTVRGVAGIGVSTFATTPATILDLLNSMTNGQLGLYGLVLLIGGVLLWRKGRYWLALSWALGLPLVALAANLVAAVYAPRFVSNLMLGLALALAAALVKLPQRLGVIGAVVLIGANLLTFSTTIPVRVPYRDVYAQLSVQAKPGDVLFNAPAGQFDTYLQWQQEHYLAADLQPESGTNFEQAEKARRVWFMTASWFDPIVQAQVKQLEPTHPVQQVIGQCPQHGWCYIAQLMEAPPFTNAQRFGANMDFWGADVDTVTATEIRTRLWWRVEQAPDKDYSISLRLLDRAGALVAQNDGPINHYGVQIVQTSQLEPGKIYIDWRSLNPPTTLPGGTYTLELVVYQSWDGQRLTLADGSDSLTLQVLTIP
ncbi:MAG: hypothetical protein GC204_01285 [Chloroflexi bacterium]|nr:hypothetical protein [Chloroflexota bacterium]